jgi:hypothetical protein
MAENTTQTGNATIAADDVTTLNGAASAGVLVQRMKPTYGDDGTARDVSAAFPLPVAVSGQQPTVISDTLTSATDSVTTGVSSYGQCSIVVAGTYAGVTVTFEMSVNGGTIWFPVQVARENDGAVLTTDTLTANATVAYLADLPGGVTDIRVRATAWTSGTATVYLAPSGQVAMPVVSVGNQNAGNGTTTSVTSTVTANTTLVAANVGRRGVSVFNDSSSSMFILAGAGTESTTLFTYKASAGGYWETPFGFTGRLSGHWVTANGAARVTEFTQ